MRLLGTCCLYFLALGVAAFAVFAYAFMPLGSLVHPDMKLNFVANSIGIYTHVFASVAALSLGSFQFSPRLRGSRPQLHRWMGRIYLGIGVGIGGLSGLYMSAFAFGGILAKLGFASAAVAWLFTGLRAFQAIRRGNVSEHRKWMIRNFSLTLAAVTLRIYLPASLIAGVPFELSYPIIAWASWLPNLLVAELAFNGTYNHSFKPKPLRGSA
jgi:uncharacterized membrane protein